MYLLAGIGNKGQQFNKTRHNVGFLIIDEVIQRYGFDKQKISLEADTYKGLILNKKVMCIKPMTYMNNSGKAIAKLISFYKIPLKKIFVFHDDIDLSLSRVKIKLGGSSAGHNGIKSIDAQIGKEYNRVRIGIKNSLKTISAKNFVLQKFSEEEYTEINNKIDKLVKNINLLLEENFSNLLNILSN